MCVCPPKLVDRPKCNVPRGPFGPPRGQSSRGHLPLLKFRHTSLVWVGVVCLGPAAVTLGFLAGPLEEKRGHSEGEWEEVRQWSHHALGRARGKLTVVAAVVTA